MYPFHTIFGCIVTYHDVLNDVPWCIWYIFAIPCKKGNFRRFSTASRWPFESTSKCSKTVMKTPYCLALRAPTTSFQLGNDHCAVHNIYLNHFESRQFGEMVFFRFHFVLRTTNRAPFVARRLVVLQKSHELFIVQGGIPGNHPRETIHIVNPQLLEI